jgi:cyanophycin synthetase
MPGNRRDEDIVAFGKIAGKIFDSVYIKEDKNLRGRKPGEVADLMKQGVAGSGRSQIHIVPSETEALHAALKEADKRKNSTVFICYEQLDRVRECLRQYKAQPCDDVMVR